MFNQELGINEIVFEMNENGFLYFTIVNKSFEISFGRFLCYFFGFDSVNVVYNYLSTKTVFFVLNSFRDMKLAHVGISLNLLFNKNLSFYGINDTNSEHRCEIIGLLETRDICFSDFFKKVLINGKQDFDFKTHSFYEIEIKLINLQSGQVLKSFSPENEQLFCTLVFS